MPSLIKSLYWNTFTFYIKLAVINGSSVSSKLIMFFNELTFPYFFRLKIKFAVFEEQHIVSSPVVSII
jgi:hypothetical protein